MSAMDAREIDRIRSAAPKRARADIITIITYSKIFCKTNVVTPQWIHDYLSRYYTHTHTRKARVREKCRQSIQLQQETPKKAAY
jgi:hypothetical protein